MFFSSILGYIENDIKKLVALSTTSQIGLCFVMFSIG